MQALPQTIHLEMDEQKTKQLKAMLGICQGLGAETRYHPEHRYFTARLLSRCQRLGENSASDSAAVVG